MWIRLRGRVSVLCHIKLATLTRQQGELCVTRVFANIPKDIVVFALKPKLRSQSSHGLDHDEKLQLAGLKNQSKRLGIKTDPRLLFANG